MKKWMSMLEVPQEWEGEWLTMIEAQRRTNEYYQKLIETLVQISSKSEPQE